MDGWMDVLFGGINRKSRKLDTAAGGAAGVMMVRD